MEDLRHEPVQRHGKPLDPVDGRLVGGTRAKTNVSVFTYSIATKKVVSTKTLAGANGFAFTSVEGLAWSIDAVVAPSP